MEGFQLWLNLPANDKMRAPWYRDIASAEIPEFTQDGVTARVIAGESHGVAGAMQREVTEPLYLDLHFARGARDRRDAGAAATHGPAGQRCRQRWRGAHRRHRADPRTADRRQAAQRADRAVRPVRDEQQRADLPGRGRFPRGPVGLTQ